MDARHAGCSAKLGRHQRRFSVTSEANRQRSAEVLVGTGVIGNAICAPPEALGAKPLKGVGHAQAAEFPFIGDLGGCDVCVGARRGGPGWGGERRCAKRHIDPGFFRRVGPSFQPVRFRAAAIGSRPGDEQVAARRCKRRLPIRWRLHQSYPEAWGGGSRKEVR